MTNWTEDEQPRKLNASKFAIVVYMVGGYLFFCLIVIAVFLLAGFVQGDLR